MGKEYSYIAGENVNWNNHFGKFLAYIKIYKATYLYTHPHPIISNSTSSGTQQKYVHIYNKNRFEIFIVATLFIVTKIRNNPNDQQLIVEWIDCAIFITVEWYTALKMNQIKAYGVILKNNTGEKKTDIHKRIHTAWFFFSFSNFFFKEAKPEG